ncbi:HTH-type transcriptional repressor purR [Streptomyces lincolnensis]|uniref:HTH-type transcriptional repressor purR n=1 Tax=Streptomyces lincolnensis TaxID=1915 RepID=A0A1B1MMJ4_STRLN|nr:LacI family DNA-binding transcriptional regulator [Streptomyces lincolnensis]ANS69774.1 HTH-type transcriptional repressor purR [Streptomyces lincolnensis]AXG58693.1 HTH-type transcriptional repressor purR [Streptomyces lincolnensis]QMV11317.1 LacI family DNA-binding transcriptional regulator [Streptomyces lincolnensis]
MTASGPTPGRRRRGPGMTEVARAAGVSQKTVSRVVNGEPHVSPQVRDRVLRVIRELDYRPNNAARALLLGRYRRIGVVSLGTALYGPSTLLIALERAMQRAGYSFALAGTLEGQQISVAVEALLEQGVDGIVLSEPIDDGTPLRIGADVPVVSLAEGVELTEGAGAVVGADGVAAARLATEHLLSLGHRTVWHIPGPQNWWAARDRLRGWREALAAAGIPEPPLPTAGDWSPASGYAAGRQLARLADVTAVFAANDDMALGALRAFAEAGLTVPDDVSVVGYDDIPAAAYTSPPLTTVHHDTAALADHAVDVLIAMIEGSPRPDRPTGLAVELTVRASSGPVRDQAPVA